MKKISIENKIINLERIAEFTGEISADYNLDSKQAFELNLVLDEVVTNIISYAYKDNKTHMIDISAEKESAALKLIITDDGKPFNPLKAADAEVNAPLQERAIGGLGIFFVKEKVDKISYERIKNRNILTLIKKI